VDGAHDIICKWYSLHWGNKKEELNNKKRKILGKEASNAIYLARETLYRTMGGIPSGFPGTTIINSIVNMIYITYGFLVCLNQEKKMTYGPRIINTNISYIVYGDDHIVAVSDKCSKIFDATKYAQVMHNLGIGYTTTNKGSVTEKFQDISEIDFLKRKFVPHPTRPMQYLAPLPLWIAEEICQWMWNTHPDIESAVFTASRATLEAAYASGEVEYNRILTTLQETFSKRGKRFDYNSWSELDSRIFDEDYRTKVVDILKF